MSSILDPAKLKVVELRAELSQRGLDSKGNKPALVKRLKEALEEELAEDLPDTSIADTSTEDLDTSQNNEDGETEECKLSDKPIVENKTEEEAPPAEAPGEPTTQPVEEKMEAEEVPAPAAPVEEKMEAEEAQAPVESEPAKEVVPEVESESIPPVVEEKKPEEVPTEAPTEDASKENGDQDEPKSRKSRWGSEVDSIDSKQNEEGSEVQSEPSEEGKIERSSEAKGEKRKHSSPSPDRSQRRRSKSPIKEDEPPIDNDKVQLSWYDSDLHLQLDKESFLSAKPYHEGAFGFAWAGVRATHGVNSGKICFEVKITEELKWEDFSKFTERHRRDSRRSPSRHRSESDRKKSEDSIKEEAPAKVDEVKSENGEEKKAEEPTTADVVMAELEEHADDPMGETEEKTEQALEEKPEQPEEKTEDSEVKTEETEVKTEETEVKTEETEVKTQETEEKPEETEEKKEEPEITEEKTEDKPTEKVEVAEVPETPLPTHLLRVGWSLQNSALQLGEDKHSYGFESSGNFVSDREFKEYGIAFGVGDVIASFLNINDDGLTITYTVNGQKQADAVTIPKSELPEDFVLFPHILSRNYAFELNLGNKEEPWFPNPEELEDFEFLDKAESKIAGPVRPENRTDCEVILMCGLPGSGKTHWANEYVQSHPEKKFTILGNSQFLDKMTISGESLKSKYKASWNIILDKLQKSLSKLVEMAAFRRRNYIIDQTNVFPSAQRRKLRPFEGFKRRAVVVVVGDEEQAKRQSLQEAQDGKDVADSSVLEMKANMSLPHKGDWIDEVIFAGVNEEEAKALVQKYNADGQKAGYGIKRRYTQREDSRYRWQNKWNDNRGGNYRDNRSYQNHNRYDRGPPRQNWHPQRPGGWNRDRRDNRGPPMGGSRDWRNRGGSPRDRGNRDNHGSGSSYNRNRTPSAGRGPSWQSGGGSNSGGGGNWNQSNWNNAAWGSNSGGGGGGGGGGSQGQWGAQGGWNNQGNHNQWKYGGGSGGGGGGGGSSSQGYGGYSNWNYYGQQQYPQNWNAQGQTQSTGAANQYGQQYSQQEWAQYAQQYAQGQSAPTSTTNQLTSQK